MSRAFWFVAGAGAGAYGLVKARRAAEALTPEGLADRLAGLSVGLHLFREEVRAGMEDTENDLRGRLGLALHGEHQRKITSGLDRPDHPVAGLGHSHHQREGND